MSRRFSKAPKSLAMNTYGAGATRIQVPADAALRPTAAIPFSVAGWARGTTYMYNTLEGIWPTGVSVRSNFFFIRGLSAPTIQVNMDVSPAVDSWNHVLWTFSGNQLASGATCYINGAVAATTATTDTGPALNAGTGIVTLGARWNGSGWQPLAAGGRLRDMAFLDYELTAADALVLYNHGRMFDWMGAELSGVQPYMFMRLENDVLDRGTGGNDGTLIGYSGKAPFRRNSPARPPVFSLEFDGTNHCTMAHDASHTFSSAQAYVAAFWVKNPGITASLNVLTKRNDDTPTRGWACLLTSAGDVAHHQRDDTTSFGRIQNTTGTPVPPDGKFHLVVIRYDGSDDVTGISISVDDVAQSVDDEANDAVVTYGGTNPLQFNARGPTPTSVGECSLRWAALYTTLSSGGESAVFAAGPSAPPPRPNRLMTTWFYDSSKKTTVDAFPSSVTLSGSPKYRRERHAA